jgi:hypothetical protein
MQQATEVHLVRVTTDEGEIQIWLAATSPDEAVDRVLDEIPEGWAVSLIQRQPSGRARRWRSASVVVLMPRGQCDPPMIQPPNEDCSCASRQAARISKSGPLGTRLRISL